MTAEHHGPMDCCDHDAGSSDRQAPCQPGMACFATAAATPAASLEVAPHLFDQADLVLTPTPALPSRPPDRTLRPPIAL